MKDLAAPSFASRVSRCPRAHVVVTPRESTAGENNLYGSRAAKACSSIRGAR